MEKTQTKQNGFYRSLFALVLPIAVQNLISTAVSSADVVMVGYVGQDALSAVSLAWRRFYFIVQAADDAYGGSDTYRNRLSDGHDLY